MTLQNVRQQIREAISNVFLNEFIFADRYYEKNELMKILEKMKNQLEKDVFNELDRMVEKLEKMRKLVIYVKGKDGLIHQEIHVDPEIETIEFEFR